MKQAIGILAFAVVLGACVRADPPSSYRCTASSDCPAGERCAGGDCLAPGECIGPGNCTNGQICKNGQCVAPECDDAHPNACSGYRCVAGICKTSCQYSDDCLTGDYDCSFLSHVCTKRARYTGESCTASVDCLSDTCCGPPGGMVCGLCFGLGSFCTAKSDCASGYCCTGGQFGGKVCASSACP